MKKLFVLFIAVVSITIGCKNNPKADYTILGEFTPSVLLPEILNWKVEKMTEKIYWGLAVGDNVKKGNQITTKEADSLGWGYAYEVTFDKKGDLISCNYFNENNNYVGGAQLFRKNNRLDSLFNIMYDTIKEYYKFKCDKEGSWIECKVHNANTDTLMYSFTKSINNTGDKIEYQQFNYKGGLNVKMLALYNDRKQFTGLESYDKDGVFQGSTIITYNDKGKLLTATFFDNDKKISGDFNRKYEYDSKGNWIKTVSRNAAGQIAIHERTYTYFE
jgi:hypothetical protein